MLRHLFEVLKGLIEFVRNIFLRWFLAERVIIFLKGIVSIKAEVVIIVIIKIIKHDGFTFKEIIIIVNAALNIFLECSLRSIVWFFIVGALITHLRVLVLTGVRVNRHNRIIIKEDARVSIYQA